jgi:hypothetical protein
MSAIMLLVLFAGFGNLPVQGRCAEFFVDRFVFFFFAEKVVVFLAVADKVLVFYIKLYLVIYVRGWRTVSGCTWAV